MSFAVQAKREIGRLWEDTDKAPYKVLFNSGVSGLSIWKSVQTLRIIDDELNRLERNTHDGRNRLLAIHGNRFIAHLIFDSFHRELSKQDLSLSYSFQRRVEEHTRKAYARLITAVNGLYPDSYLASLFKNGKKCQVIKDEYQKLSSGAGSNSQSPTPQQQLLFTDESEV